MNPGVNGQLVPVGGGDPYPLTAENLRVGRRSSCDIWLNYPNISSYHCELQYAGGCWQVVDMGSTNGTRVNDVRVRQKKLRPGDKLTIGKHVFTIEYALAPDADIDFSSDVMEEDVMSKSLLERAGLSRKRREPEKQRRRIIDDAINNHHTNGGNGDADDEHGD
jgi:adenylate cyclase